MHPFLFCITLCSVGHARTEYQLKGLDRACSCPVGLWLSVNSFT